MSAADTSQDFYYRIFGRKLLPLWEDEIREFLQANDIPLEVLGIVEEEDAENLDAVAQELLFVDQQGNEIALMVCDTIEDSEILPAEIAEFRQLLHEYSPVVNRNWVDRFLGEVKVCYALLLNIENIGDDNWQSVAAVCDMLRYEVDGIEQSDGGMITNEEGNIVLVIPDEPDSPAGEDSWYPNQVALWNGKDWDIKEVSTESEAEAFLSTK